MKLGGSGGSNTRTGIIWEDANSIAQALSRAIDGLEFNPEVGAIFENGELRYSCFTRSEFWQFLLENGFTYNDKNKPNPGVFFEGTEIWSARLYPDEVIYDVQEKIIYIFEKKYQQSEGSVDEKLRTIPYRNSYFHTVLSQIGIEYGGESFVLSDWFRAAKYRSPIQEAEKHGAIILFPDSDEECIPKVAAMVHQKKNPLKCL